MLSEKTMVVDALNGVNGELSRFGEMIPQTENKELKPSKEVSVSASYLSFFGVFFGFCGLLKCQGLCNMI